MRYRLLLVVLLHFALAATAQSHRAFQLDSAAFQALNLHDSTWAFANGDNPAWASPAYNDSAWQRAYPAMFVGTRRELKSFTGIGWFRLHIKGSARLMLQPIALTLQHTGASVIYLDGDSIAGFGTVGSPTSAQYVIPNNNVYFTLKDTDIHVLAVRYCNHNALSNDRYFGDNMAGFKMEADDREHTKEYGNYVLLFFGMTFLVLALSHFFLFLYYRAERSNLPFSVFCLSFSALFFIPFATNIGTFPALLHTRYFLGPLSIVGICLSLNWMIDSIFNTGKRLRWLLFIMYVIPMVVFFIDDSWGVYTFCLALCTASGKAILVIIKAVRRKVPGSGIIGGGLITFSGFAFVLISYIAIFHGIQLENDWRAAVVGISSLLAILSVPASISAYLAWRFATVNKSLLQQLTEVQRLSEMTLAQQEEKKQLLENQNEKLEKEVAARTEQIVSQSNEIVRQHNELKLEKAKSDDLLRNILPAEIAEELKQQGHSEARFYDNVTILFTDFVNFTQAAERLSPQQLVDELHTCFKAFDEIISRYNLEKIKTIGDAYLAVGGLPTGQTDNAVNVVQAALDIREFMLRRQHLAGNHTFGIRIGIHSGSVVAGIVGIKKFAFDIWGDAVNTAARMEQNSEAWKINISETTFELVKHQFTCTYRGEIDAKNKGLLKMYFVDALK
ncbi:MAG: hypothetical protein EBZ77_07450 [Chitinophagia bacterium]|nr:hypothetical protein [Chitinophagia bacterium]